VASGPLIALAAVLAACAVPKTIERGEKAQGGATFPTAPVTRPAFAARQVMDVCWPHEVDARQGVAMTFIRNDDGVLKDVVFETREGATNPIGRCLREVAMTYPWEKGTVPASLDVTPPLTTLSGWLVLAYVRLISESTYGPER